jgi:magnesium transporter
VTLQYQPGLRALLCSEDGSLQERLEPDDIDSFIAVEKNLLWLDVDTAVTRDLGLLQREFGFHALALEDALRPHQRAKVETYDGYTFVVFYAATLRERARRTFRAQARRRARQRQQNGARTDAAPNLIELHQIAMFIGGNYLVTVHRGPLKELDEVSKRWHDNIHRIDRSIGALVYSLLDTIVDDYIRRDSPIFGEASLLYFQDVYDHVVRVSDSLDIYRDLLSSALDAYLSMASNRLNQVMKTLTSWTIPLMAASLIAGIYGMNFDNMPELHWRLGYVWALGWIVGLLVVIVGYFRHKRWL